MEGEEGEECEEEGVREGDGEDGGIREGNEWGEWRGEEEEEGRVRVGGREGGEIGRGINGEGEEVVLVEGDRGSLDWGFGLVDINGGEEEVMGNG